ncbi:hypothetical protein HY500_03535 [Candidatus Woesearchaeota archaeon]|nr:hypothetical protein [Candidatus Woesearchaeota archaeon]
MAKREEEYDDPYLKPTPRRSRTRRVAESIYEGPPSLNPFRTLANILRGPIGWVILLVTIFAITIFLTQSYRQGALESVWATTTDTLSRIPGFSYLIPKIEEGSELIVNPSQAIIKTSNSQWKASVDATEVDNELGLNFVSRPSSTSNLYFTNEKIIIDADLAIKIPQGKEDETSVVSFGCLGETNGEVKGGIVVPAKKEIFKGEKTPIHVNCEFPENTFTVDSSVIQSENKLQPLKVKFIVDYEFSSYAFWEVYTKGYEILREDRQLGDDPFDDIKSRYIADRTTGKVASQPSKAPMRIILGGLGQPYSDRSDNENGNFLGVSFEEYGKYAPANRGVVREIKDIRLRIPNNFVINTEQGDFIEVDTQEDNRREYQIRSEKLAELNARCERLGVKEKLTQGYLSEECFKDLILEDFSLRTSFNVDYLESDQLTIDEVTAKTEYLYETYDTLVLNLRRPQGAIA